MIKKILLFWLVLGLNIAVSQTFTFSDTAPSDNPDSLLQVTSRANNQQRLVALLRAERSYYWQNTFRLGSHLQEINQRINKQPTETGKACLLYLQSLIFSSQNKTVEAAQLANQALLLFQKNNDNSGVLHSYGVLIMVNSTIYGNQIISDPRLSKTYVEEMKRLSKKTQSPHDELMRLLVYTRYLYGQGGDAVVEFRKTAEEGLRIIQRASDCRYGLFRLARLRALGFRIEGKVQESYQVNKEVMLQLTQNQPWELGTTYYNTAVDCYDLKRINEGIVYCKKAIELISKDKRYEFALAGPYTKFREFSVVQKNFEWANQLADSVMKYNSVVFIIENDKKMIEIQSKYEFERKQQEIRALDAANRQKLALLAIAVAVVLGLGIIGFKLYTTLKHVTALRKVRDHFFTIVVHDLRRPLFAFHDIGKLIDYYLEKNDLTAIQTLTQGINESALRIEKMLNNLLNWGLSQQEIIPYQPENILIKERVEAVVDLFKQVNFIKKITFQIDIAQDMMAFVDPNTFDLVLRNLIDNSFKAIPTEGMVLITAEMLGQDRVIVQVKDNAGGIQEDKLRIIESIFESPSQAQVGEYGMGMGLITSARFMKRNGGKLQVSSEIGHGTSFTATFPRSK